MKKITSLIPVLFTLFGSGCASFGPTILIETEQPEEDFVVLCEWYKDGPLNIHGGMKQSDWKAFVTESGKEVDCGMSIWGGHGSAIIMHPVYISGQICEHGCEAKTVKKVGDTFIVKPMTLNEFIDYKSEAYRDQKISKYLGSTYSERYFRYYKMHRKLDIQRMRILYDDKIKNYWNRVIEINKNEGNNKNISEPNEYIENYWKRANEAEHK